MQALLYPCPPFTCGSNKNHCYGCESTWSAAKCGTWAVDYCTQWSCDSFEGPLLQWSRQWFQYMKSCELNFRVHLRCKLKPVCVLCGKRFFGGCAVGLEGLRVFGVSVYTWSHVRLCNSILSLAHRKLGKVSRWRGSVMTSFVRWLVHFSTWGKTIYLVCFLPLRNEWFQVAYYQSCKTFASRNLVCGFLGSSTTVKRTLEVALDHGITSQEPREPSGTPASIYLPPKQACKQWQLSLFVVCI